MRTKAKVKWTPKKTSLLGTMSDADLAQRLGCSKQVVQARRYKLGIKLNPRPIRRPAWGNLELGLLGAYPDAEVAKMIKRSVDEVAEKRKERQVR